ncbi:cellobiose phosphorylase [Proteiniclasticum sp. SCR006]|uniref:Cellobiose phosphorylase n=1 Tax=Proteiniclasticum aestuarii TaxID=2817862 RepID=A0A939HDE2_9CLOT|nr:cellobiose phosphorylase [Proteiniclasticum aestuarii]MBO1265927.1 cellobiose phosphorylase [Proteiniclasticum aestuarii]
MGYYYKDKEFVIENYDKRKPFSSFLPGIAGIRGIPLWVYYANRGQGITSFGLRDKNEPIQEFFPANTSYQYVDRYGFRSFVKVDGEVYEPFAPGSRDVVKRTMFIAQGHFTIEEINETRKITYRVTYFGLTNEPVAGLVREVEIVNDGAARILEVVDGIANILPSGTTNETFKNMSNLMVSWMGVENMDHHIPFYKFRASSGDDAEISMVQKGHFYLSFMEDGQLIPPIVDLEKIFGYDTSLSVPTTMESHSLEELDLKNQVLVNKVPCGFSPVSKKLEAGEHLNIHTIIGSVSDVEIINEKAKAFTKTAYISRKREEAEEVLDELVNVIRTESAYPVFDAYLKQNFLDNTLRGGFPLVFGEGDQRKVYHVFSRKHGDPERDYNFFSLAPEFYSQGNGNFRDVNQNRRSDVLFTPEAGLFNVKMFMNLLQLDGYNPLGVQGTTFTIEASAMEVLMGKYVLEGQEKLREVLSGKFTPGNVSMKILLEGIRLDIGEDAFMDRLLEEAEQHIEAVYGEGYWSDHWTYNFDLVESYRSVYPDRIEEMLFEDETYRYYDSPVHVLPRREKYGRTENGVIRQYGAIEEEEHSSRFEQSNWKRVGGEIYKVSLAQKLLHHVMIKFTTLDPFGMGVEMEADRPGWNDAMNGLPGLFGSGMSETVELVRVVRFLRENLTRPVRLLDVSHHLYSRITEVLSREMSLFERWDALTSLREDFREKIREDIGGNEVLVDAKEAGQFLERLEGVLMDGINRAKTLHEGVLPTYLIYKVTDYEVLEGKTPYGLQRVRVKGFELEKVPFFLEGPARFLKIGTAEENRALHHRIRNSGMYDPVLKTYRTSASLEDMSYETGRIRAFTPGWLERESNFLHMTYKYLLGLLKGGLPDLFFEEIRTNLVCFMDPEVYGRSTLENSSFIASSLNPNSKLHGQGFVSRLSGSTAEMLSIWQHMMFGKSLFTFSGELCFSPEPILGADFFVDGRVTTTLLSDMEFIIENDTGLPTYSERVCIDHYKVDGKAYACICGDLAQKVRDREVKQIIMIYKLKEESL